LHQGKTDLFAETLTDYTPVSSIGVCFADGQLWEKKKVRVATLEKPSPFPSPKGRGNFFHTFLDAI
jgi:hypothetical protein